MRRLAPPAAVALPPISPVEVSADKAGWTVTDRRPPVGSGVTKAARRTSHSPGSKKARAAAGTAPLSARGVPGEREAPSCVLELPEQQSTALSEDLGRSSPPGAAKKPATVMKGRAIHHWLNHTLAQAGKPEGAISSAAAKQMQGLSQFGIDNAALEKLGLDAQSSERVYRAMFVYSQGLHAVLQEAVGRAKSSSAALLVLWRAFTAVLEHAGQSEEKGENLAALVQRGNEEEQARIEAMYRGQVSTLQHKAQELLSQRETFQEELGRLREDEMRLRSESDMYKADNGAAMAKYEKEIKLRVDAEVRFLDKTRFAERLQADLTQEQKEHAFLQVRLKEEVAIKESAQIELESTKTHVKFLESQANAFKQSVAEAQQARQRHEQQVGQMKQQHERMERKLLELKDQLEHEQIAVKRQSEQSVNHQREIRRLERQAEDDAHIRKELQSERDSLREKLDRLETDSSNLTEERRNLQMQLQDLNMEHRSKLLDLKRKADHLERVEAQLSKFQKEHSTLLDAHRVLVSEVENLREDVNHLDAQCLKESDLRKQLQYDKKVQAGQLQTQQIALDNTTLAIHTAKQELQDITEAKVKLEAAVRDTKSAMQKLNLEHQVQLKAHMQKVAMLEKVISDERNERRSLVAETQEVTVKREEAVELVKRRNFEIQDLRRQRLDKEEEVDRYKVLLKAQEQRNSEQLVTIDKYHAAVANHDSEMRQIQALLECERHEANRELQELQDSYAAAKQTLEQRIGQWRFSYEDVLSRLNFNPSAHKIQTMEVQIEEHKTAICAFQSAVRLEREKTLRVNDALTSKSAQVEEMQAKLSTLKVESSVVREQVGTAVKALERQSMSRHDAEHHCERIRLNNQAFDEMKASLEGQLMEARGTIIRLQGMMRKDVVDAETQVVIETAAVSQQTDLSYQYLESSSRLNDEKGRRERLTELKKASIFVEDPEARRDFVSKEVCQAVPVSQVEMTLDTARGAVKARVSQILPQPPDAPQSGVVWMGGKRGSVRKSISVPVAPDAFPTGAAPRPPSEPLSGARRSVHAFRSSIAGPAAGVPLDAGIQVSHIATDNSDLPDKRRSSR